VSRLAAEPFRDATVGMTLVLEEDPTMAALLAILSLFSAAVADRLATNHNRTLLKD
jgi:threonine/homoserine efflux transporter RhtA